MASIADKKRSSSLVFSLPPSSQTIKQPNEEAQVL